jgi:uncharacterized protein (TIGR02118 family)
MYKVVWFARYPQDKPREEYSRYWSEHHGPLAAKAPGFGRYVQNHVTGPLPLAAGVSEEKTQFDGYSLGYWKDEETFRMTMASDEWLAVVDDGYNVFDMSWLEGMSAELDEHVIIDGPASPYKVCWVVHFKPGIDPAEARDYWKSKHGPIVRDVGIDRYVQNHCLSPVGGGGEGRDPLRFDGFSECWFKDEAAFLAAVNSPTWEKMNADGYNLFDMDDMWGAVLDEKVKKAGDAQLSGA